MENGNWREVIDYIQAVLFVVGNSLGIEAIESIKHYLEHDEYEMAFEILCIETMALKRAPKIDFLTGLNIGKMLRLNEGSVFDAQFWTKFEKYMTN